MTEDVYHLLTTVVCIFVAIHQTTEINYVDNQDKGLDFIQIAMLLPLMVGFDDRQ
jgi:hypothetical protein